MGSKGFASGVAKGFGTGFNSTKKRKTVKEALDAGDAVKPLGSGVDTPTATKALPGIDAANKGVADFNAERERGVKKFKDERSKYAK